jgi:RimJ/RimL family protein N-acetyltransferase
MSNLIFEPLKMHPEFTEELREIYWNEWSDSIKIEFNINIFSEYKLDDNIKYYLVLEIINNTKKLVGTIASSPCDLEVDELKHLTPWLSYVYILPEYRNKGIAKIMINWFLNKEDIRPIYLWCIDSLKSFYSKFNFEIIDTREDKTIMKKI